jgi:predicted esterase
MDDVRALVNDVGNPRLAYLAPAAAGKTWFPYSLLEPLSRNRLSLDSALRLLGRCVAQASAAGRGPERIGLLGFSQGASVVLEYVVRNARRYGAVIGLSGALLGPEGTPRDHEGSLTGTPVFLGSGDSDPHISKRRMDEARAVLERQGAQVTERIYPGLGHAINDDEKQAVRTMLEALTRGA